MEKLKIYIIFILCSLTLIYNLLTNCFVDLLNDMEVLIFLQGHIQTKNSDSIIGIIFDYVISILFNVNIKDLETYLRIFGG